MVPPSNTNLSLRRKSRSSPWGPAGTKHRLYSEADRELFFEAFTRLGSAVAAARELGFIEATCTMWAQDHGRDQGSAYSAEQKTEFFAVLDRANSVAAAAKSLGINVQTAFKWAYSAGAVTRKPRTTLTPRQEALAPLKAEFLKILTRVGNISEAARRAGIKRSQGESWATAAGIQNVRLSDGRREEFNRLRTRGLSRKDATAKVGVNPKTAYRWDQAREAALEQQTLASSTAGRPREFTYNCEVTSASVESPVTTILPDLLVVGPALPPPPGPRVMNLEDHERVIDPRFLSVQERVLIADMLRTEKSIRAIARTLGRSASTISREITRNSTPGHGYQPHGAHRSATQSRARPKPSKLAMPSRLRREVKNGLQKKWSPEQISNTLILEFPHDPEMRVCPETIYQSLYVQARGGLKREVQEALRSGRTRRKPHRDPAQRRSRFRDPMVNISERPAEVQDRAVPGHWEGDLVLGAHNGSAIATLVERSTRFLMLVHLENDHTAETVRDGLIKTMGTLPAHLRGSLTWDQGVEMAKHKAFALATDMDVYFCDPHSPWQRGSNENTNGLLRQYFPKGTDLSVHSPEELERVAREINERPRKTLGWDTPAKRLRDLLIAS